MKFEAGLRIKERFIINRHFLNAEDAEFDERVGALREDWTGYAMIHTAASRVGGLPEIVQVPAREPVAHRLEGGALVQDIRGTDGDQRREHANDEH